ncbi:hypothetical protein [Brevibacillus borstelensis]|uniref:hypothetical protein n=1 Tax=Brevibacillus borstelensis TaxID=45462 RepID=UPI0030BBE0AF
MAHLPNKISTKTVTLLFCCFFLVLLCSCSSVNKATEMNDKDPDQVLNAYFEAVSKKDYATIVTYYGGEYQTLIGYNPSVPQDDYAKLMEEYCTVNGGNIVKIDKIIEKTKVTDDEYIYKLSFLYPDNTSFENGKQIEYTVKNIDGSFKVMDLPPYIP